MLNVSFIWERMQMYYNDRIKNKLELLFSLWYSLFLIYSDFSYIIKFKIFLNFYLQFTGAKKSLGRALG